MFILGGFFLWANSYVSTNNLFSITKHVLCLLYNPCNTTNHVLCLINKHCNITEHVPTYKPGNITNHVPCPTYTLEHYYACTLPSSHLATLLMHLTNLAALVNTVNPSFSCFLYIYIGYIPHIWCCKLGLLAGRCILTRWPLQSLLFKKFKKWQDSDVISNVRVSHLLVWFCLF
jgi:hypothetical protein